MSMQFLKRFPEDKQEQIQQLMGYISLLGVTGKDLISIGGYIERGKQREAMLAQKDIALSYKPEHIQGDAKTPRALHRRFKIYYNGSWYAFERKHGMEWEVKSRKTGKQKMHHTNWRDWGPWAQRRGYEKQYELEMYDVLLDVHDGRLKLDF